MTGHITLPAFSFITVVVAALGGCSAARPNILVEVDAIASPAAERMKRYVLRPDMKDVQPSDLQFQEYATYIDRALSSNGFVKVSSLNEADLVILVGYGISQPRDKVGALTLPNYGQTGIASSRSYGTINPTGSGTATYSGTTYYQPTYGVTGYSSHLYEYTEYDRILQLNAVDAAEFRRNSKVVQTWRVLTLSTGSSGDLRKVFPYLVTASAPYLGKTTNKQRVSTLFAEDDEAVIAVRDGAPPKQSP